MTESSLTLVADVAFRIALVAMFPLSAIDKVVHWREALAQTESSKMPGGKVMLIAAILIEAVTPLMIVTGVADRLGAFLLAGFCVVTAFLYHPFWRTPGFWSPTSPGNEHYWQFFKNWGLAGGLMLVVCAGGLVDPLWVLRHPLSSSFWG